MERTLLNLILLTLLFGSSAVLTGLGVFAVIAVLLVLVALVVRCIKGVVAVAMIVVEIVVEVCRGVARLVCALPRLPRGTVYVAQSLCQGAANMSREDWRGLAYVVMPISGIILFFIIF